MPPSWLSTETKDIAELTDVRRGRFKFSSASFFMSFLAALEVERNAAAQHSGVIVSCSQRFAARK